MYIVEDHKTKAKDFEFKVGKETYKLPPANNLCIKDIKLMNTAEGTLEVIERFAGKEVIESMTQEQFNGLVEAYVEFCKESAGADMGES